MDLKGKVAIVTGASSGLGKAAALALAKRGCIVVLAARRAERLKEIGDLITRTGGKCLSVPTDVVLESAVVHLFDQAEKHFGTIDILVNNAGRGLQASIENTTLEQWESIFNVNVTSVFLCTREAVKRMRAQHRRGRIITVSSIAGLYGGPEYGAYCASKHAATGLMRSIKWEVRQYGIKVFTIHPARIDTEFFNAYSRKPRGNQMLSPEDIAASILAAASGTIITRCRAGFINICKRFYYLLKNA